MTNWYTFNPVDTVFFRGAEPMSMGENHTASSIFPPPAHTISGAVRTAVLIQKNISFDDYGAGVAPKDITDVIGNAGEEAPFNIIGPLFMEEEVLYIPAPYCWFMEKNDNEKNEAIKVYKSRSIETSLIKTEFSEIPWVKGSQSELVSLGGSWIKVSDINSQKNSIEVARAGDFFATEERTGIALHENRRVRTGHLYSFNHARLKRGVSMVFGIDKDLPFADNGVLYLGAERRFGEYKKLSGLSVPFDGQSQLFMSLSIVEGSEEANNSIIATGKIIYLGGWDLNKGFHKPMKGFFPAGTVCNKKLNSNFIAIQGG